MEKITSKNTQTSFT